MELDDRFIVLAGGAGALGRAMTRELQQKTNARVCVLDYDQAALDRLEDECSRFSQPPECIQVDLSDPLARSQVIDKLWRKEKRIDVWVNAMGYNDVRPFSEMTGSGFKKIMQINFHLPAECCQEVLPRMLLETTGKIVNIASVAGVVPSVYMSGYVAAKHALVGLTRCMQAEMDFLGLGPQTLLVLPGFFDSQLIRKGQKRGFPQWLSWFLATPENVAASVIKAIKEDRKELVCTANGRLISSTYKLFPSAAIKSSRMGLTRGFRDWLVGRYEY